MKVAIITFHFPYNCGAALQCFALQSKLQALEHEVTIINYRPWYHLNRYVPRKNPYVKAKSDFQLNTSRNLIKRCCHCFYIFFQTIARWRHANSIIPCQKRFDRFQQTYFHETRLYRRLKQLRNRPPQADAYVAGSDQLWNASLTDQKIDPAYLLDFGSADTVRISYAVGMECADDADLLTLQNGFLKFTALSLRENKHYKQVRQLCPEKIPVYVHPDPTLLLDSKDYEPLLPTASLESEPFVVMYVITDETEDTVLRTAEKIGAKTKYAVINIYGNPNKFNQSLTISKPCGPSEFLWYIKHASFVITNSFHGTIFSVIYRKRFVSIPHSRTGYRVTELLDTLCLSSRYCRTADEAVKILEEPVCYEPVLTKLSALREDAVEYLKTELTEIKKQQTTY